MKKAKKIEYLVFATVFIMAITISVYAQSKEQPSSEQGVSMMHKMNSGMQMQKMHDGMTKSMDSAQKESMEKMHESCMKMHSMMHESE